MNLDHGEMCSKFLSQCNSVQWRIKFSSEGPQNSEYGCIYVILPHECKLLTEFQGTGGWS